MAHPGGRPTKYKKKYIKLVDDYIKENESDEYLGEGAHLLVKLPTIEGFSLYLNVVKKTIYNWAEQHEEFLHAIEKIEKVQKEKLIKKGLSSEYNPTITKLLLSANHGMREKSDVTTDGQVIPTPIYGGNSIKASEEKKEK